MTIDEAVALLALDAKAPGLVKWDTSALAKIVVATAQVAA